jgi:hypothetical protein
MIETIALHRAFKNLAKPVYPCARTGRYAGSAIRNLPLV